MVFSWLLLLFSYPCLHFLSTFISNFWHKKIRLLTSCSDCFSHSLSHSLSCCDLLYGILSVNIQYVFTECQTLCRHRRYDSEQNRKHPCFCGAYIFSGIFIQFYDSFPLLFLFPELYSYILISLWDMAKWMSFWPLSLRMCNIEFAIPVPYHSCS